MSSIKEKTIRIGAIGAAKITPSALLEPARYISEVEVTAIASRNNDRANSLARRYNIPKKYNDYHNLLTDPDIDAVYIALPNAFHAEFIIAALKAGKHVLCEKPLASNYKEASFIERESAKYPKLIIMEAFHWRYHPIAQDIMHHLPMLGRLKNMYIKFAFPLLRPNDIRWELDLAGGAMMDIGTYAISFLRMIKDMHPKVIMAKALLYKHHIDRRMDAELLLPDDFRVVLLASMLSTASPGQLVKIEGSSGKMEIRNPFAAHRKSKILITVNDKQKKTITYPSHPTTYQYQLRAFADVINGVKQNLTSVKDAVKNFRIIDQIYSTAGLIPRPSRLGSLEEVTNISPSSIKD